MKLTVDQVREFLLENENSYKRLADEYHREGCMGLASEARNSASTLCLLRQHFESRLALGLFDEEE